MDDLSHDRVSAFFSKVLQASREPSRFPLELPGVLLDLTLTWTSPTWTKLFSDIATAGFHAGFFAGWGKPFGTAHVKQVVREASAPEMFEK